jgi:hypothetical protein
MIDNYDAPPQPIPPVHTGSPAIINNNDDAPTTVRCPQTQAELRTCAESNIISSIWYSKTTTFPISPLSSNPTNCITATRRPLRHLRSGHTSLAQTQAVSLAPSLTKIQVTYSSIANSSSSPNIGTFGHVALPMSLGGYFKVFASTRAPTPVSSSRNQMSQKDAHICMAVLFAIIVLRRTNHTGLGSPWVVIALTTLEQEHAHCQSHHSKTPFQLHYLYSWRIVLWH